MLSLVGSVQPDPFSPEHVPQSKQDREQQHQRTRPSQRPISETIASEVTDDDELDAFAAAQPPSPADDGGGQRRKEKEKKTKKEKEKGETPSSRGKGREGEEKVKRNRKEDRDVPKLEHKPKRKKTS